MAAGVFVTRAEELWVPPATYRTRCRCCEIRRRTVPCNRIMCRPTSDGESTVAQLVQLTMRLPVGADRTAA